MLNVMTIWQVWPSQPSTSSKLRLLLIGQSHTSTSHAELLQLLVLLLRLGQHLSTISDYLERIVLGLLLCGELQRWP
jgi:hypothetical protein